MNKGDVVQFNENHKWCGSLGVITDVKDCGDNGIRYQVMIDIPKMGRAYIFVMSTENALEYIGRAVLTLRGDSE